MADDRVWIVRAGRGAAFADEFREQSVVALGWGEVADFGASQDDEAIEAAFAKAYPEATLGTRRVWAGQVKRFFREMAVDDEVVTYDPDKRVYLYGKIASDCFWRKGNTHPRTRKVTWTGETRRDDLTPSTRNTLGSIATFFRAGTEASAELRAKLRPIGEAIEPTPVPAEEPEVVEEGEVLVRQDVVERAASFIEDRLAALSWEDMQQLVAGVLRAMGYKTRVSEAGADRGNDIFASPDGLGLQEPRIFVEVKHRAGTTIGAPHLRQFLGGRKPGDRCLYVSTGGFSREAAYEAERSTVPVRLIDLPLLRELVVDHYDRLDPETRALVPLVRVYWPA